MSRVKIQRVATQLGNSNRTGAATRLALQVRPLGWLVNDATARGKIVRRSLAVKRRGAQARVVALRERSRRIDQMCALAASPSPSPSLLLAAQPATPASNQAASAPAPARATARYGDEPLVRTLDDHVQPVESAVAASAVGMLFSETNEVELAFLMRLIAEGDTATATRIARRIVESRKVAAEQLEEAEREPLKLTWPEPQPQPKALPPPAKAMRARTTPPAGSEHARGALSPRELNVLRMISQGLSNREIAESSYRSLHTVDAQVKNIYRKLAVNSRAQAVREAMQNGLISLERFG